MIRPSLAAGQNVVHVHHSEGEVGIAAHTNTFLFTVEAMTMGAVVGQIAQVRALGRGIQGNGTGPQRVGRWIYHDPLLDQLDGQQ